MERFDLDIYLKPEAFALLIGFRLDDPPGMFQSNRDSLRVGIGASLQRAGFERWSAGFHLHIKEKRARLSVVGSQLVQ